MWKARSPAKVKHFVWNAVKGNMVVKERLWQCHITMDTACTLCEENESILHVLLDCVFAKEL